MSAALGMTDVSDGGSQASAPLASVSSRELLAWLLRRRRRFCVSGSSMAPTLFDGQQVLVDPHAYARRVPAVGEIVLVRHPFRAGLRLIKRVRRVEPQSSGLPPRLDLRGDNPGASTDSRALGSFDLDLVEGRVVASLF